VPYLTTIRHEVTAKPDARRERWRRNRRELRRDFTTTFVVSLMVAAAAFGASLTAGPGNVALILVAAVLAAIAAWFGLWLLFLGLLAVQDRRGLENAPSR
jgi:hypothetical protein